MTVWALIPVKGRENRKTRLAQLLSHGERIDLVRQMLDHVLAIVGHCRGIDGLVVMSPERDAIPANIEVMPDAGNEVNESLMRAVSQLHDRGVDRILILPADLPWLAVDDLEALMEAGGPTALALAPDQHEQGTNGLCLPTAPAFRFCFGEDSLRRHTREAARLGLAVRAVRSPGLAFDVDRPADFDRYRNAQSKPHAEVENP